ncbi:MAG: DnaD domain protein [Eubacteriales bacterium]|nr:DnaD domain protein [Eubacteriales bacterium]
MQLQLKNNSKSTAVPNRFIECSLTAPEKYTASYLLGLMYASTNQDIDFDMFCARLDMSEDDVIGAFEYWQKRGFAHIVNTDKLCFEFGVFSGEKPEDDLYTEREFNQKLQNIFGSRQLSPHEYIKIYDYTDMFHLPKKVVLALAEYCVLMKGRRVGISYMDKVAQSWAELEYIDTEEKAREKIAHFKTASSGVLRVLKQLGISGRGPTKDEAVLFDKWTGLWGFTLEAVLTACAHTTAAREPSMKYLDRILERLKADGDTTSRKISEKKSQSDSFSKNIKELMHIIGEPSLKPSYEYESLYQKWTSVYGFDMDMLIMAARLSGSRGKKPFPYLDDILTDWYNNRVLTAADARAYIALRQTMDKRITAVFETAGIAKKVTDAHRKTYARWNTECGISHDAILLAAEISSLSENPYRYLNTILSNWHDAGVKTLADAQRETKKYSVKQNTASRRASYERPIENYDHLAIDFFKDEGA